MYRIAYNESLTQLKKQKKSLSETNEYDSGGVSSSDNMLSSDEIEKKLADAISILPEKQRMVFHYRYYDDLSFKEISAIMGTSEGGLKANYHHAVTKIKEKLEIN